MLNSVEVNVLEPEFKVERRDSLGMASKEHTQNLVSQSTGTNPFRVDAAPQSELDTNAV